MRRIFGLSRDPFLGVFEEDLYCEFPDRAEARREALAGLSEGRPVCVCGPSGSGRGAFLEHLAEDLALAGHSVLWAQTRPGASRGEFLTDLLRAAKGASDCDEVDATAEALYEALLEAFARSGTLPVFPSREPLDKAGLAEARILQDLRVAGWPVVTLALSGNLEPPLRDATMVRLRPFSPAELRDCLVHRATACGAPDILSDQDLREVSLLAQGIGDALARARQIVLRRLFAGGDPRSAVPNSGPSIFDPAELEEVGSLLEALAPARVP